MAASKRLCPRRIPKKRNQDAYGKQDLFAVVIAFRYLLTKEDFSNFKRKLVLEIGKLNKKFIYITETELLELMGFPNNWKNIARYHTILQKGEDVSSYEQASSFFIISLCTP